MKSISKFLGWKIEARSRNFLSALLFLCVLSICSTQTFANGFVVESKGDVKVMLQGEDRKLPVSVGSWLTSKDTLIFGKEGEIVFLCLETRATVELDSKEYEKNSLCPSRLKTTMRSSDVVDIPVVLLPNQRKIGNIKRIIWTGPEKSEYSVAVIKFDVNGKKIPFKNPDWSKEENVYWGNGIHEFVLNSTLSLPIENSSTYQILVTNTSSGRSSAERDDLVSRVQYPPSEKIIADIDEALDDEVFKKNSDLKKMARAAQLLVHGYLAEAYEVLQTVNSDEWSVAKQLYIARSFSTGSTPAYIKVIKFGEALRIAVSKKDTFNAAQACAEVSKYSRLLAGSDKQYYENLKNIENVEIYCSLN